ncbi:MAG: hypothetical protein KAJ62_14625, partial [Desulfobacteraceae bacterium]|nr:hypothetical protein [Desulfobacteraceae bacterium]
TKHSHHSKKLNVWNNNPPPEPAKKIDSGKSKESSPLDPELQTLKLILEALTGKKIRITDTSDFIAQPTAKLSPALEVETGTTPEMAGWGIDYQETITINETEQSAVTASGIIKTKDGKNISFSIDLVMKREFQASSSFSFKAGDALIDPLVINMNQNAADLTDTEFKFDINSDGIDENLAWLQGSSGFLVFDKNKNGIADNGTELFGPTTGNGFNELAELDYDNNSFIDENDPDFRNLMLWSGNSFEESQITSLKHHGIGAIGLINVKSEFSVNNELNITLGKIQRTGIYLRENGQAGTIQQLDLSV